MLNQVGIALAYAIRPPDCPRAALSFVSGWPHAFDNMTITAGAVLADYCSLIAVLDEAR